MYFVQIIFRYLHETFKLSSIKINRIEKTIKRLSLKVTYQHLIIIYNTHHRDASLISDTSETSSSQSIVFSNPMHQNNTRGREANYNRTRTNYQSNVTLCTAIPVLIDVFITSRQSNNENERDIIRARLMTSRDWCAYE